MMFRAFVATAFLTAFASVPGVASAHGGGHRGGCEDFGHVNLEWARNAADVAAAIEAALGIDLPDDIHTLGGIVSWFANHKDSPPGDRPGVGDVVATFDHAACGPQ